MPLTYLGEGKGNNYAYLVTDDKTKDAVIIDPANPSEYGMFETRGGCFADSQTESCLTSRERSSRALN